MAPNLKSLAFLTTLAASGGTWFQYGDRVSVKDKPARKPLVGKGSKWHRRMVESGRK